MNRSTILTCVGAIGVVVTSVLTAKATTKAVDLILEAELEKGDKLTKTEKFKTVAPSYIPAVLVGASTIACMFGANVLNTKQQASLMSAYALLDNSYKEYRGKVEELYGEGTDERVQGELAKEKYEVMEKSNAKEKELFFDFNTLQYFEAPMDEVLTKTVMDDGLECYIISTPFDATSSPLFSW